MIADNMRLQVVTGVGFVCKCFGCGKRLQTDRDVVVANLAGPAFKAYYCLPCLRASDPVDEQGRLVGVGADEDECETARRLA